MVGLRPHPSERGQTAFFLTFDLYWHSQKPGDLWYESRQLKVPISTATRSTNSPQNGINLSFLNPRSVLALAETRPRLRFGVEGLVPPTPQSPHHTTPIAVSERRGDDLNGVKGLYLKAKARIWP